MRNDERRKYKNGEERRMKGWGTYCRVLPEWGGYMFLFTFSYYPLNAYSVHIHASLLEKKTI